MSKWIPYPANWINSGHWHTLTPRARVLLFCLWGRSENGEIPTDPKLVQIMAGVPDRPKRITEALEELKAAGFIEDTGSGFFLAQFRQIFAKFRPKSGQNFVNSRRTKQKKSTSSADSSRARTFPPKGEKKRKEEEGQNATPGRSSFSSELDPRVFEIMEGHK